MAWRVLVVASLLGTAACSPYGSGAFACTDNSQCGAGTCADGYCAFSDSTCASGERYGALSGPMSNACVGATTQTDAGSGVEPLDAFEFLDAHVPMDGTYCYGTGLAMPCFTAVPSTTITIQASIDTDTSSLCQSVLGNPPWCVIAGNEVTVTNAIAVTGSKPLVLVAVDKLDVVGTLSAASTRTGGEVIGASADYSGCDKGTPPTAASAAGGAGGSFGGNGGDGGDGIANNGHGTHGASQTASALRGGCVGQAGAAVAGGTGGPAGHGGGVLALVANGSITVEGIVNASGEGAGGGVHPSAGGGGGGAGGLIVLDAPTVSATGSIFTNGGGGGEASGVTGNDGVAGNDPTVAGATATNGATSGGQGGAGGVNATAAGAGGSVAGHAGGGGGGSVGVIKLYRATSISGGTVTPPPS
jgi:hypothetical protein